LFNQKLNLSFSFLFEALLEGWSFGHEGEQKTFLILKKKER